MGSSLLAARVFGARLPAGIGGDASVRDRAGTRRDTHRTTGWCKSGSAAAGCLGAGRARPKALALAARWVRVRRHGWVDAPRPPQPPQVPYLCVRVCSWNLVSRDLVLSLSEPEKILLPLHGQDYSTGEASRRR
jgi:hypothetical protein